MPPRMGSLPFSRYIMAAGSNTSGTLPVPPSNLFLRTSTALDPLTF